MDQKLSLGLVLSLAISIASGAYSAGFLSSRVSTAEAAIIELKVSKTTSDDRINTILTKLTSIETQLSFYGYQHPEGDRQQQLRQRGR